LCALAGAALALAWAVAGCSNVHGLGHGRTLNLALTEYRIDPQSVRARPGQLTIVIHNYGRRTHNLVLSLDGQPVGATKPIWPGSSSQLTLSLPAGSYVMASTILSDRALGEYGTLVVK
jgi:hypothetical protein